MQTHCCVNLICWLNLRPHKTVRILWSHQSNPNIFGDIQITQICSASIILDTVIHWKLTLQQKQTPKKVELIDEKQRHTKKHANCIAYWKLKYSYEFNWKWWCWCRWYRLPHVKDYDGMWAAQGKKIARKHDKITDA